MSLLREMGSRRSVFSGAGEEALLGILATAAGIDATADALLRRFRLTRVQFNILMLLKYEGGLSQTDLARRLIVTAANVSVVLNRLESKRLVGRERMDRRTHRVRLSRRGRAMLKRVEPRYDRAVVALMRPLKQSDRKRLIALLDKLRRAWRPS